MFTQPLLLTAAVGVVPRIGAAIPLPSEQLPANLVAQLSGDISELEGFIRATEKELRCAHDLSTCICL